MNRVAVFGNSGGGKSTFSKKLAQLTGLPLVPLDLLQYRPGGSQVPHTEFKSAHDRLLEQDQWIVDGFGSIDTVWKRLDVADTLVYLDMPLFLHYWWVTKRFLQSLWIPPEGWPDKSSVLQGTLKSYSVVWLCHQKLTPKYREYVERAKKTKQVYHLRSPQEIQDFLQTVVTDLKP